MERPAVGIGVILRRDGKILLGKRKNTVGAGMWAFPGGRMEMYEEPEETAKREVREEVGLEIDNLLFAAFVNTYQKNIQEHFFTLVYVADCIGEPRNMEPDKCEGWEWFDLYNLPSPLFWATRKFIDTGYNPFQANKEV